MMKSNNLNKRIEEVKEYGANRTFFPAEWYPQSGVQLTWPHEETDWKEILPEALACFKQIAQEIAKRQRLLIVAPNVDEVKEQIKDVVDCDRVLFVQCPTNDTWARDHSPITRMDNNEPTLIDFTFNGWGMKFPANYDNLITCNLVHSKQLTGYYLDQRLITLEGGALETDGLGTLLTTSECLLSANRNEWLAKEDMEEYLKSIFRLKQILWLNHGYLAGDDTDSHIDTLARFCSPQTIAYVKCSNSEDEHFEELSKMEDELREFTTLSGDPYELIPLPLPDPIYDGEDRLPATYANFLIVNEAVLYPTYNQPENDLQAKKQLEKAFPGREIVGIDCRVLIKQHGSLHCVTMQYPIGVLKD